jgi:hypothetical protein
MNLLYRATPSISTVIIAAAGRANVYAKLKKSHRDLALVLAQRMDQSKDVRDGVRAAELFYQVILGRWDRFSEVETIVVMELNQLLMKMAKIDQKSMERVKFVDARLIKLLDLDVRITLSWDADNTDVDLHIIEPSGEEAFYGHNLTTLGGLVSRDFTQGYGPEEYVIHRAMPGIYQIRCHYYGSGQQTLMGPATVTANVITNYGRPNEHNQLLTLRLSSVNETVDIGAITFGTASATKPQKSSVLSREKIQKLKKGMSEEKVLEILGEPDRRDGGSLVTLHYHLSNGQKLKAALGPDLLWVREILESAEHDLL